MAGSLRWGAAATDGSCSPTSTAPATRASITVNGVAEYQWKASFAAQRSTTYCYRVLLGPTILLGTDVTPTFATGGGAGSSASTFAVFGDWGKVDAAGANQDQANVMRELSRSGAQFAISTGDGATGVTVESQYGDLVTVGNGLSAVFGPLFWTVPGRSLPLFPTLQNHGMANEFLKNWPTSYTASRDGAVAGTVGQPASGTVSFTDSGRTPGTAYSYVVTASDAAGNSTPSDAVVLTTSAAGGGGTTTLTATADAKVDASLPATNYGTAALRADASPDVRSYVKFDASALTGAVQSATLRIWATSAQSVGFDVYGVANSSWSENAITYANQPSSSISATKAGSSGTVAAGTWKTVDVTALVSGPGTYSVVLESTSATALALASREDAAHAPQLVVTTT